jgi:cholesterol transport system auxiliary component
VDVKGKARVDRRVSRLIGPALGLLLSGCSTLIGAGGPPPDIYDLTSPAATDGTGGRVGAQLLVPPPGTVGALSSNRIAVRPDPARIAYYPGGVWSDELPALVQLKLVRAFENSGRARAVGRPGESLAIDFQVIVDIRAFEIDAATDTAHVELGVKLLDDSNGRVRATHRVDVRIPAATTTVDDAVASLDRAAGQALSEVVDWTATTL